MILVCVHVNNVVTLCCSPIKDINDVIELTVLDENGDRSPNLLGKVSIPLLTVSVQMLYV